MYKRQNPNHEAKTQEKTPAKKTSQNIKINHTNQNQNRQMHQRKLVKDVIQHETVHISQREKPTKRPTPPTNLR